MATTPADVRAVAPELAALSDGVLQPFVDSAVLQTSPGNWGKKLDLAVRYMAAHLAAVSYPDLARGVVREEHAGPVGKSYAVREALAMLDDTRWGRELQRMRRQTSGVRAPRVL